MRTTFQSSIKNRSFLVPLIIGGLIVLMILILGASNIRYSELQVPVRYSSFGITNFYREQWYYQLAFMAFGLIVYAAHTAIGLKLLEKKGQGFAVAFQWLTVVVLLTTLITIAAIFQVAELV